MEASPSHKVILGLGSNMGKREEQLQSAVGCMRTFVTEVTCSAVYESQALLPPGAPKEWNIAFLNMAIVGVTPLSAIMLLAEIKALERKLGRAKREHWGPRAIDIDILAYDDEVISEPELTVPHARLLERDFAMIPLAEIAPEWVFPDGAGKTARELSQMMPSTLRKTELVVR